MKHNYHNKIKLSDIPEKYGYEPPTPKSDPSFYIYPEKYGYEPPTPKSDPSFYIYQLMDNDELSYWNIDTKGWVMEFENATPFTGEILTLPLPQGATGIMPFSNENEPLAQYNTLPGGEAFEKVF